jgi:hypothetical protein
MATSNNCATETPVGVIWSSVQPSTNSIVKNWTPPASSMEKIAAMFG